ncbi:pentapeptide repeat-containing protein [Streptomyces sp. NBC_00285]|uniref:pentapeptide repeat-containing protein n=1 Tax=Streptomyces sp. NBC_00285 TaxID=2975700 RepID=UPI002E2E0FC3|nr:pentapeptide repeat-containing protein [Streptomyces sp. NBC_00285]
MASEHAHSWQGHDFDFTDVTFDGADLSDARFSGGTVSFAGEEFSGGTVSFSGAEFSGSAVDFWARFSGGTVSFSGARFSDGTVGFDSATFCGSAVDFTHALGSAPSGLVPPNESSLPTGLSLPSTWHPAGS